MIGLGELYMVSLVFVAFAYTFLATLFTAVFLVDQLWAGIVAIQLRRKRNRAMPRAKVER